MATGKQGASIEIAAAERQRRALELRKGGASLRAIGDALGCSHETARQDVAAALAALVAETRADAEVYRTLELERLDALQLAHWSKAMRGDYQSSMVLLRVFERRARLLGLDATAEQPGIGDLLDIVLRWSDGRRIIDVTPHADDHATAAASLPGDGGGAPGPLQGPGGGSEVGQVAVSWGVIPEDGGAGRAGLVGGADLSPERDGLAGAEDAG